MQIGRKEKLLAKKLEQLAFKVAESAWRAGKGRKKPFFCDVFLLGDAEMRRIKKRFLPREKGPANVLSFAEPENWPRPGRERPKLGELYLNMGITGGKIEKLLPLLVHGVLHLSGYDHKKKSDRMKMEKLEKEIILKCKYQKSK